ncbi:MAG: protoporphyrinogen oxidase, partial [Polyangiales bacterium]
ISTLPRFVAAEAQHRSLILGLRRQDPGRQASGARYGLFVSLRQGLGQLTQRLTDQLAPHLHLQQRAVGLTRRRGLWQVRTHSGQSWTAPRLILALPAWRAADLLRQAQPALAQALAAIRYGSSVSVTLGWHSTEALARPLDAYGLVVPAAEGLPLQAATWSSAKYPGRAPAGGALIRCFFGGHGRRVRTGDSDAALSALALDQLRLLLGRVDAPDIVRVVRYPRALPRYEIGHAGRITAIEDACARAPGLALAGNAYHGIGIAAAIASGHAAADKLAALP